VAFGEALSTKMNTWEIDDFSGGLDLRHGPFSEDQTVYRLRKNVYSGKGKQMERRPANLELNGRVGEETQGFIYHQGNFYVFKKRGDPDTGYGSANDTTLILEFDPPEYTTTWELIRAGVHEGSPWAEILHQGTAGAQIFLHTWDGLISTPTYVMDPGFPGSYSTGPDELAGQVYDPEFRPVAEVAVSKLWVSNLAGNVQCCRTADTRVWNQRTSDSLLQDGEHYVFRVPGGVGVNREFTIPSAFADIKVEGRWAYYLLEKAVNGYWETVVEVNTAPAANQWQAFSSTPAWAGGVAMVGIRINWSDVDPGLIRLRMVAGSTSVVIIGDQPSVTVDGTTAISMKPVKYSYRGGDAVSVSFSGNHPANNVYLLCIGPDGAALWDVTTNGWPNGYQLERRRIVMKLDYTVLLTQIGPNVTVLSGTVTTGVGSQAITGAGTKFLSDFKIGDWFAGPNNQGRGVQAIASDTAMTAAANFTVALAGTQYGRSDRSLYKYAFENEAESGWYTGLLLQYIDQAGAEDALQIGTRNYDPTGGFVSAIGTQLNRLIICYPGTIQSWSVDQATNATGFLDRLNFGTGAQLDPNPVPFYESVAIAIESTERSIYVSGPNNDTLKDNNIGEPIDGFPMPQVVAACHWVKLGQLVIAGVDQDGLTVFLVYDYSRESKISSWNEWRIVADIPVDPRTLIPLGDRLYFRSGTRIRYFDTAVNVFRDADEEEGDAYWSDALTHLNQLGKPNKDKALKFFDITADGETFIDYHLAPNGTYGNESSGPILKNLSYAGCSYGDTRLPLHGIAPAVAVRFRSRDESGWRLRQFSITFQYKDR